MQLGSIEAIKRMVAAGLGYSIIPRMAVEAPRDREGLHVCSLAPLLHRQLAVVMRHDKILSKPPERKPEKSSRLIIRLIILTMSR